jgi:hypothetical protein
MADLALIYEAPNQGGPGTHVLLIGIGTYSYLVGGSEPRPDIAEGMGQLDAPPKSARCVADWFLDEFNNPDRPLRSLALVLSEPEPSLYEHAKAQRRGPLPTGTVGEVADAIDAWVERASFDPGNQTIFFFCGHGVSSGESILLLRDFGGKRQNRFDGALNLNDFVGAMQTKVPEYQLFLIDACRVPTVIANSTLGKAHLGRTPLSPDGLDGRGGAPAKQSVHHAASSLEAAFGRVRGASLYTEALLRALSGGGAQPNLKWWIGTNGLQTALAAYTERLALQEGVEQQPEIARSSQFQIHKPQSIVIPVYVTSRPPDALMKVSRLETRLGGAVRAYYDPNEHGPCTEWATVLAHREHEFAAKFPPAAGFDDYLDVLLLSPPSTVYEFEPKPRP